MIRSVILAGAALTLNGCSSFNMVPPCAETGQLLMELMATRNDQRPDHVRLADLMSVASLREVSADYNRRTCSADVTAFGETVPVTYDVVQAEGAQDWMQAKLRDDPAATALRDRLRAAYAQ